MTGTQNPPTPKGAWPVCANHPSQPLDWREDGLGWRCPINLAVGQATPQPWEPGANGNGAVSVKPWEPGPKGTRIERRRTVTAQPTAAASETLPAAATPKRGQPAPAAASKRHRWPQHPTDPNRPNAIPCRYEDRCLDCGALRRQTPRPPCIPQPATAHGRAS